MFTMAERVNGQRMRNLTIDSARQILGRQHCGLVNTEVISAK